MAEPPIKIDIIGDTSKAVRELLNLDKQLSQTATNAGKSVGGVQDAINTINNAKINTSFPAALQSAGRAGKLTSQQMLNLGYQVQDLGVQFAMAAQSSKPLQMGMMALIQQGSQIYGIGQQAGLTFRQMGVEMLKMVGILKTTQDAQLAADAAQAASEAKMLAGKVAGTQAALAEAEAETALALAQQRLAVTATEAAAAQTRLAAADAAVATAHAENTIATNALAASQQRAAATGAASIARTVTGLSRFGVVGLAAATAVAVGLTGAAIAANQLSDNVKKEDLAKKFNLTAEEAKKLKDTGVTMGDVLTGTFTALGKAIWSQVGETFTAVGSWIKTKLSEVASVAKKVVNFLIGSFVAAYQTITQNWSQLPAAIGDAAVQAANAAITAINGLLQKGAGMINSFLGTLGSAVGISFGQVAAPQIGLLNNQWAGAGSKLGKSFAKNWAASTKRDYVGEVGDFVTDEIMKARDKRLKGQADKLRGKGGGGGKKKGGGKEGESDEEKAAKKYAEAIEDLNNRIQELNSTKEEAQLLDEYERAGLSRDLKATDEKHKKIKELVRALQEATRIRGAKDAMVELDESIKKLGLTEEQAAIIEARRRAGFPTDEKGIAALTQKEKEHMAALDAKAAAYFRLDAAKNQSKQFGEMMTSADQRLQDLGVDRQAIGDPAGAEKRRQEIAIERAWMQEQQRINELKVLSQQQYMQLTEQERLNGGYITEQMRQQLYLKNDMAKAQAQENAEMERKAANAQVAADIFKEGIQAAFEGKQAMIAFFKQLMVKLLAAIVQAAILSALLPGGGGGFGAQFTKALGFRAGGGSIDPNRPYIVGEQGPELFMPGRAGQVVRNSKLSQMGGGRSTHFNPVYNIQLSGNAQQDQQTLAEIKMQQQQQFGMMRQNERSARWR